MKRKSTIVTNRFILGEGPDGIYSNITIDIRQSVEAKLSIGQNIELKDKETLRSIIREFESRWIEPYQRKGINLEITILEIGFDPDGRKYAIENSVGRIMHDALNRIGVKPPQVFGL